LTKESGISGLNNIMILIQGLLSDRNRGISMIASDLLNKRAHTTLTRFLNQYDTFWFIPNENVGPID